MAQEALINVMTAAVVVSALALVAQALMLLGTMRAVKALRAQIAEFLPKAETFLSQTQSSLDQSRREILDVTAKASSVLDTTQKQLALVDEVLSDASSRARSQMDRVELVLDDSVTRVHRTVVELNDGILRPIREINGVAAGLRAAFHQLLRGGRPSVDRATADEEMFI